MGRLVIACYRPEPGRAEDLAALTETHVPRLRAAGLATEREPVVGVAADGTVVEVFEWVSAEAIARAHEHPDVLAMWAEYEEVCTYVPVAQVPGATELFTGLEPLT